MQFAAMMTMINATVLKLGDVLIGGPNICDLSGNQLKKPIN